MLVEADKKNFHHRKKVIYSSETRNLITYILAPNNTYTWVVAVGIASLLWHRYHVTLIKMLELETQIHIFLLEAE